MYVRTGKDICLVFYDVCLRLSNLVSLIKVVQFSSKLVFSHSWNVHIEPDAKVTMLSTL